MNLGGSTTKKAKAGQDPAHNDSVQSLNKASKEVKNNDWIPTEAVRAILSIRDRYEGQMNERCISRILYEQNGIWREIMRKENAAIKKRLSS